MFFRNSALSKLAFTTFSSIELAISHRPLHLFSHLVEYGSNSWVDVVTSLDVSAGPRPVAVLDHHGNGVTVLNVRVGPPDNNPALFLKDLIAPGRCSPPCLLRRC